MPGYWINGGALVGTLNGYRVVVINDEDRGVKPLPGFNYQNRLPNDYKTSRTFSGWSFGAGGFIDPNGLSGCDIITGNDNLDNYASWEPWSLTTKGPTRPYYIYGQVFDVNGNPVVGAAINSFVTATDVKDGATVSGSDGKYQAPCYNRTASHYISAYKAGSPSDVAGESVDTLTPSV